jgi:hypothetical protein
MIRCLQFEGHAVTEFPIILSFFHFSSNFNIMTRSPRRQWLLLVLILVCSALIIFYALHRNQKSNFADQGKSIAVIPFTNADTSKGNDYLSEGITGEIINRLTGISGLRVASSSQIRAVSDNHLNRRAGCRSNVFHRR